MIQAIGPFVALASMVFLVRRTVVGLRRHPDKQTIMEAVVVGFLLFTFVFGALR